jgi:hypothetical protein
MANKPTTLSIINDTTGLLPGAEDVKLILEDLGDLMTSRRIFGIIGIAGGDAGVFKVLEPGTEETISVMQIEGVIVMSHAINVRWGRSFAERSDNEKPACKALDGITGVDENGEIHDCATCPYNKYTTDGERKACMNRRQLYILRKGDIIPVLLTLPPSALRAYDNYRINLSVTMRKRMNGVVTRITLASKKNKKDIKYSAPVFDAVAEIPALEAQRIAQYTESIVRSAQKAGIDADEIVESKGFTRDESFDAAAAAMAAVVADYGKKDKATGYVVSDEDIPDFEKR